MRTLNCVPNSNVRAASDYVNVATLTADAEQQYTVPADAYVVVLTATGNFWAKITESSNTTAITRPVSVTNGAAPELNPGARAVTPGQLIHLIAPAGVVVCLAFYRA